MIAYIGNTYYYNIMTAPSNCGCAVWVGGGWTILLTFIIRYNIKYLHIGNWYVYNVVIIKNSFEVMRDTTELVINSNNKMCSRNDFFPSLYTIKIINSNNNIFCYLIRSLTVSMSPPVFW